jgi:energy-coupling factor transporter transmembrane protein EcfT
MAGRAFALMLAFSLGMSALSLSDMLAVFDRLHLRGLGFALGVAMNLLATLQEMARTTFETIKLRGGLRRPLTALRLFLVTLISNTLRYGDQIVNAATVRAFDPAGGRARALSPRRADLWLVGGLVACAAGCWLI